MAFNKHVGASANVLKTNDVIEDWRHWLAVAGGGQAAYTIYSILEITAAVYFTIFTTQRGNDSVSWSLLYGTEIQFMQNLHSIYKQSVLQVGA